MNLKQGKKERKKERREILSGYILHGSGLNKRAVNIAFRECVLLYLLKGSGIFIDHKKRKFHLRPGDLIIRQPETKTTIIRETPEKWLEFAARIPRDLYRLMISQGIIDDDITLLHPGLDKRLFSGMDTFINMLKFANKGVLRVCKFFCVNGHSS
ncbi:MAG: hypothetical protein A2020_08575 [Lentisphaerae bacterium GWF2_45_14]|nr:MAG: hypothetical protein A2020_08575 [Lentisphaerae bacterium GWF2_45_14]